MKSEPGVTGVESAFARARFHPAYWKTLLRLRGGGRGKVV
jgi:hypothetical protein